MAQIIIKVLKENCFSTHNTADTKCVGFFSSHQPQVPQLWTPAGCPTIKFNSFKIYLELEQTLQVKNSVSQDCPASDISHKSRLSPVLLYNWI